MAFTMMAQLYICDLLNQVIHFLLMSSIIDDILVHHGQL